MDKNPDVEGSVEVHHGVRGVEDHHLTQDLVDLAGAQGSYGPVGTARQTQLLVLPDTLKHL